MAGRDSATCVGASRPRCVGTSAGLAGAPAGANRCRFALGAIAARVHLSSWLRSAMVSTCRVRGGDLRCAATARPWTLPARGAGGRARGRVQLQRWPSRIRRVTRSPCCAGPIALPRHGMRRAVDADDPVDVRAVTHLQRAGEDDGVGLPRSVRFGWTGARPLERSWMRLGRCLRGPRRLHVERQARPGRPGQAAVRGRGSPLCWLHTALEGTAGAAVTLNASWSARSRSGDIVLRARAHARTRTQGRAQMGKAAARTGGAFGALAVGKADSEAGKRLVVRPRPRFTPASSDEPTVRSSSLPCSPQSAGALESYLAVRYAAFAPLPHRNPEIGHACEAVLRRVSAFLQRAGRPRAGLCSQIPGRQWHWPGCRTMNERPAGKQPHGESPAATGAGAAGLRGRAAQAC